MIDGIRIYLHIYPPDEWEGVQETLKRHIQEVKSELFDQDTSSIDWNDVMYSRSTEISSNLQRFMNNVAKEDAEALAESTV